MSIVSGISENQIASPFDAIRGYRQDGSEYWTARELTKWLGYTNWRNAEKAIERAIKSLENQKLNVTDNIVRTIKLVSRQARGSAEVEDFELSRFACYLVAMNADPEKEMVALAQGYFATQTRKAEVIIPVQNDVIRALELEIEVLKLRRTEADRQDLRIGLHGLATTLLLEGKSDAVVEIDRPTLEIIDARSNSKYEGQTLTQVVEHLSKTRGIKIKSGKELARILEKKKLGHLMAQTPRSILTEYVPTENLQLVYDAIGSLSYQQLLIG